LLIDKGADLSAADSYGMTALYAAVDLRQVGPLINRPTPKATSDLDNLTLVTMLLDRGANPNVRLRLPILPRFHNAGHARAVRQGRGSKPGDQELHDGADVRVRGRRAQSRRGSAGDRGDHDVPR